jgi:hypothetical protein
MSGLSSDGLAMIKGNILAVVREYLSEEEEIMECLVHRLITCFVDADTQTISYA